MKKIPTMFERDWNGDRSRVVNEIHSGCEWVALGEGVATRKIDGTCCMVRDGIVFKRRELRDSDTPPPDFELADYDDETKKSVGWVPVGDGPEDKWFREAMQFGTPPAGTYELVGPKVQGNPEHYDAHEFVSHGQTEVYEDCPRAFDGLREWLSGKDIEGIVFHHPDGRMAKIKLRDFGIKRSV
jgi:Family of unknown function (DUF5565)